MPVARIITNPHFGFITPEKIIKVAPTLATWGAAAGSAVLLFGSDVPLVKRDLLSKIPIAGSYWEVSEEN
ncbi:ubiquinol-cytochrome-c reductase complex subunit-domain-containing protein [Sporodiniella umbellata]|nr:ubiquinol-cytochrome-c reductase complex subunit-domain-containing protein [Sporodiniella umbellata]